MRTIANNSCYVCGDPAELGRPFGQHPKTRISCPRCGIYVLPVRFESDVRQVELPDCPRIACWIRDQNESGVEPDITNEEIGRIFGIAPLSMSERVNRLLMMISSASVSLNAYLPTESSKWAARLQTFDTGELKQYYRHLNADGLLDFDSGRGVRLTVRGAMHADSLKQSLPDSAQAFVAMWFDPSMDEVWATGIATAIEACGYRPMRIDRKEHANKICDEIVAEIRRSRFVVSDYTGHRGGVYFEAGYAMGRGLPVILTCREDGLDKLHFDIRQYNCIAWDSPQALHDKLVPRIGAVIGDGPFRKGARQHGTSSWNSTPTIRLRPDN